MTAKTNAPGIDINIKQGAMFLVLTGHWLTRNLAKVENSLAIEAIHLNKNQQTNIEFSKEFKVDTAGCWVIAKFIKQLNQEKINYTLVNPPLFLDEALSKNLELKDDKPLSPLKRFLEDLGREARNIFLEGHELVAFFGEVLVATYNLIHSKKLFRWVSLVHHLQTTGFQALGIVGLISFLIGAVLAYQGITQLDRFGASVYTIDFLAISLLREISVLLTSVVIAGRSGSAFTAQIGTMALNQEIDAIKMLGLDPITVLVIPRVLALLIALPLLVFFAIITGLLGGMVLTSILIDVSAFQFWSTLQRTVSMTTFWVGMSKAPLFSIIIGIVGCFRGLQVKGSAESIGTMTTKSVVEAIFLVIIADALMSIVYSTMGL